LTSNLRFAHIRAILFDIDGTLADTDDDYVGRIRRFMKPFHLLKPDRTPDQWAREFIKRTETPANIFKTMLDRLYIDEALGWIRDGYHNMTGIRPSNQLSLMAGIHDMLANLQQEYQLAIVTAREHRSSMAFLTHFNLLPFFKVVVTARTTLRSKPHPAPIHHAAACLGVRTQACIMVGDTTVDMRAACSAGATAIGVLCGFGEREELSTAGAAIILKETRELDNLLAGS